MLPTLVGDVVRARCPGCGGAISSFESKAGGSSFGSIVIAGQHTYGGKQYSRVLHVLLRCAGCGLGGIATVHDNGNWATAVMERFYPTVAETLKLPEGIPEGIAAEFREAETCINAEAYRAASAMFRSTLEKVLRANGYVKGTLAERIDDAAKDGIITEARRNRAHDEIRVLGNDVLHDEWRAVTLEEVELAHHYVQRILEDLYDDRKAVQAVLREVGRLT